MNRQSPWLFEAPPMLETARWSNLFDQQLEFENEWEVARGKVSNNVNALLPKSGLGFYSYSDRSKQFGLPETILAIKAIGNMWHQAYPKGPRIGIGEISLKGGGKISGHRSHRIGLDMDMRAMPNDGIEKQILAIKSYANSFPPQDKLSKTEYVNRYRDWLKKQKPGLDFKYFPDYSQLLTQKLVNAIGVNGHLKVKNIFFNDPAIKGVSYWPNHNNHLHIRFHPPGK